MEGRNVGAEGRNVGAEGEQVERSGGILNDLRRKEGLCWIHSTEL